MHSEPLVLLGQLTLVSGVMALLLFIAWHQFQRELHVLAWSASYAACGLQWLANAAAIVLRNEAFYALTALFMIASITLSTTAVLLRRGRRRPWQGPVLAGGVLLLGIVGGVLLGAPPRLTWIVLPSFAAAMFGWAMVGIMPAVRPASGAEWTYALIMAAFSLFELLLALLAVSALRAGPGSADLAFYRLILGFGTPILLVASGLAAILMVSSDLSARIRRQALLDPLTGVFNRRGLEEMAERLMDRAGRAGVPVAVAVGDVELVPAITERHGREAGDAALQCFANVLVQCSRGGDLVGRVGGNRFVVVMPRVRAETAAVTLERIHHDLAHVGIVAAGGRSLDSSFGVAMTGYGAETLAEVLALAAEALYLAKQDASNRIRVFGGLS